MPRIVILGAGFGGLFAAKKLAGVAADVTVIDRHNYHLFQPLLYQVATAGLPPSDIAWPIRSILSRQKNTLVLLDEVMDINVGQHEVILQNESVTFDYLVVATGSTHSYFGHEDWETIAPGLKSIDDATYIRRRILTAFEQAEMTDSDEARERLLRFVIVGGGPTGVELAGTIAELAHHTLAADFRRIDPRSATITLVEAGPRLLPYLHESLSDYARQSLEQLGVEVRLGTPVTCCDAEGVTVAIAVATVIWAAGVTASPVGQWLDEETDKAGRVVVRPDLSIKKDSRIFVIGDHRVSALQIERQARLVDMGHCPHLFSCWCAQSFGGFNPLAVGVHHLWSRCEIDYGCRASRLKGVVRVDIQNFRPLPPEYNATPVCNQELTEYHELKHSHKMFFDNV